MPNKRSQDQQDDPKAKLPKGRPAPPQGTPAQPADPMGAMSKASGIGPFTGDWTPLSSGADMPIVQVLHALLGNAQRNPQGGYAINAGNMAGIMGGAPEGPSGTAGNVAGPIARFLGWQRGLPEQGIPHTPLYNVEAPGHPLHGSTVGPAALEAHGIPVPTPPPPNSPNFGGLMSDAQGNLMPSSYFRSPDPGAFQQGQMQPRTPAPPSGPADPYQRILQNMGASPQEASRYGRVKPQPKRDFGVLKGGKDQ